MEALDCVWVKTILKVVATVPFQNYIPFDKPLGRLESGSEWFEVSSGSISSIFSHLARAEDADFMLVFKLLQLDFLIDSKQTHKTRTTCLTCVYCNHGSCKRKKFLYTQKMERTLNLLFSFLQPLEPPRKKAQAGRVLFSSPGNSSQTRQMFLRELV